MTRRRPATRQSHDRLGTFPKPDAPPMRPTIAPEPTHATVAVSAVSDWSATPPKEPTSPILVDTAVGTLPHGKLPETGTDIPLLQFAHPRTPPQIREGDPGRGDPTLDKSSRSPRQEDPQAQHTKFTV